jgi:hypothetical protein
LEYKVRWKEFDDQISELVKSFQREEIKALREFEKGNVKEKEVPV